jgi:hypothetical protein
MEKYRSMNDLKIRLLSNWNLWRVVRLVLSIVFIFNGIINLDYVLLASGVFILGHALLNACISCAGGNCEIPQNKNYE